MKNLVKIDLNKKMKINTKTSGFSKSSYEPQVDIDKFIEVVGGEDENRIEILNKYITKFQIFALDLETLELAGGYTKDNKSFINEDYFRRYDENQFIDLSDTIMYMEYDYLCVWGEDKIWGKLKKELGDGYNISWELYPLWGSRKARILDLLLDEE